MSIARARDAGSTPPTTLEPCAVDRSLAEGDRVVVGDLELECIETPGHADGHLSFLLAQGERAASSPAISSSTAAPCFCRHHDCRLDALVRRCAASGRPT